MKLRAATLADAKSIADIHAVSWRNTYQRALTEHYLKNIVPRERHELWKGRLENPKSNQHVVVADFQGDVVGFVCVYTGENPIWGSYLDNLHVRSAYQSKGVGKALLTAAVSWCFRREPTRGLCLLVNRDNIKAQEFYIRFGARNAQKSIWSAPDGSAVPTYWFVWDNLSGLAVNA
jgi:ribosomal protein S18 acetylase RimI-like enzyme